MMAEEPPSALPRGISRAVRQAPFAHGMEGPVVDRRPAVPGWRRRAARGSPDPGPSPSGLDQADGGCGILAQPAPRGHTPNRQTRRRRSRSRIPTENLPRRDILQPPMTFTSTEKSSGEACRSGLAFFARDRDCRQHEPYTRGYPMDVRAAVAVQAASPGNHDRQSRRPEGRRGCWSRSRPPASATPTISRCRADPGRSLPGHSRHEGGGRRRLCRPGRHLGQEGRSRHFRSTRRNAAPGPSPCSAARPISATAIRATQARA